jgi:N-methylhydantoinase B
MRRDLGGLVDGEPVLAGQVVRVVTTGGGGWGDPLEREPELVRRDVVDGKVSATAARGDYGVVLRQDRKSGSCEVDAAATNKLRARLRARRKGPPAMIDRGTGYDAMTRPRRAGAKRRAAKNPRAPSGRAGNKVKGAAKTGKRRAAKRK